MTLVNGYVTKDEAAQVLNLQSTFDVEYSLAELGEIYKKRNKPLPVELENPESVVKIPRALLAELKDIKEIAIESVDSADENKVPNETKIQQITGESNPLTLAAIKDACYAMIQMGVLEGQALAQRDHAINSLAANARQATQQATNLSYVSTLVNLETDAIQSRAGEALAQTKELMSMLDPQAVQNLTAEAGLTSANLAAQQKLENLQQQMESLGKL
jgi:23S rRNA maturation mini-RNase III